MKPITNFPGYFVDEDGVVWTEKAKGGNSRLSGQKGPLRKMSVSRNRRGYCIVSLVRNGKSYTRFLHRLVLEAFVGPRPDGMEACHYPDHDKSNNRLNNLRWDTHAENQKDKYRDRQPVESKECRRCKSTKPRVDFYRDSRASDGLKTECKACHSATAIATRDPEKKRAANREFMRRKRAQ